MPERPPLLVVSAVRPYPGGAGQEQRVRNKLLAFREDFRTTFLVPLPEAEHAEARERLAPLVDEALVVPSTYLAPGRPLRRAALRLAASVYSLATGLKTSNFLIGKVELGPSVVRASVPPSVPFAAAVYEYWHAVDSAAVLQGRGVPCVLDMHDVLWRSRERQLAARRFPTLRLIKALQRRQVRGYRRREEAAWRVFDALVTINREEHEEVRRLLPGKPLFHAPMGVDMDAWSYGPEPAEPPRIAYFGALGNAHNEEAARRCVEGVMPAVWRQRPETELYLVGSRPSAALREVASRDPRVTVTGFVDDAAALLRTVRLVLCPWRGTYGFRSRLIEVMALGVPVVASPDAVAGMDLEVALAADDEAMAARALEVLAGDGAVLGRQARRQVETRYSFTATYTRLSRELRTWCETRRVKG